METISTASSHCPTTRNKETAQSDTPWQLHDAQERARIRAKYAQRSQERKIEMYFKALELVRQQEMRNAAGLRKVATTFTINFASQFGQELYLVGNVAALGSWDPNRAVKMSWSEGNQWTCEIKFPKEVSKISYKYIVRNGNEINWEWGKNHELELADRSNQVVMDVWGGGSS